MNRFEKFFGFRGEAKVKYGDAEYQVIAPGDYVRCAVTGEAIALDDLRYWNVARQEAYLNAAVALARHRQLHDGRKSSEDSGSKQTR